MNQNYFVGPIIVRYLFFIVNFYFTIKTTASFGWSFLSVLLAIFATRDFVHAVRLTQVFLKIKNHKDPKK